MNIKPTYNILEKELEILKETTSIIERSPAVVFLWENLENWPVEFVSKNVKNLLGYSTEEFLTNKISYGEIIHPNDLKKLSENVNNNSNSFSQKVYRMISKKGETIWVKDDTYIRRDENGKITHYEGIILDITKQKIAEQELLKKNQELLASEEEIRAANEELIAIADALKESNEELIIAKEKTEESEKKFRELFEKSGDSILIIENGKFIDCNRATIEILKHNTKKEFLNSHPSKLSPKEQPDGRKSIEKADEMIEIALEKGTHRYEWNHKKSNGEVFPVEVLLTAISNKPGKKVIHTVWRDITDRKKAEQSLKESEKQLKKLNTTKDMLFSIIAHDLRGPFNTMLGFSQLLINKYDKYDVQEQKKFLGILNTNLKNIYNLLENLLLWSRSQQGTINFNPEKENLYLISSETFNLLNQWAVDKSITLINQIPEDIYVEADKNMLLTILRNLISNAIKFTAKGGEIKIKAQLKINGNEQNYAEISVKDSGLGISKDKLACIFKISEKVSTKGTEGEQGTGLGLSLCKEFVEKHKGEIWVESEIDKGCEFIFTLPAFL